jgi:hypothetical protein
MRIKLLELRHSKASAAVMRAPTGRSGIEWTIQSSWYCVQLVVACLALAALHITLADWLDDSIGSCHHNYELLARNKTDIATPHSAPERTQMVERGPLVRLRLPPLTACNSTYGALEHA